MALWTLLLLSLGVAMDAVAVAASTALTRTQSRVREAFRLALTFGLFQSAMAAAGWIVGDRVLDQIAPWDHWIAFALLGFIGGKMILEAIRGEAEDAMKRAITWSVLLVLGVATSIDSLAVGVTLPMLEVPLALSIGTIGAVTFALSLLAALAASRLSSRFGRNLEILGGVVLIAIGLKILVEHLW